MVIKKIVFFVFIIIAIFVINDMVHSINTLWQKHDLVDQGKQALAMEEKKNRDLKQQYKIVTGPKFIEEEARNKLFMVRPGEGIVVVAPTEYLPVKSVKVEVRETRPNWKQWWDSFF